MSSSHRRPATTAVENRGPVLARLRNLKMARSAHAYVRGSTVRFYDWLEGSNRAALPEGPPVWICGDCHLGNLGPLASAHGLLAVQVRDLDQTVIGNPAHDLVRLGLSLAMAARGSDLPGITTARMIEGMVAGYESAFTGDESAPAAAPRPVKLLLRLAARRSWKHLADERIEGVAPRIPIGARFWPLSAPEATATRALVESDGVRELIIALRSRADDSTVEFVDSAFWCKGCSSLGNLRFAILAAIRGRKQRATRYCLLDVKEAVTAAAPRYGDATMPRGNADRVVEGARHISPHLGGRIRAARMLDKSVFVRELMPQDLKLELDRLQADEATDIAHYLASVVGEGHGRQMSAAQRKAWLAELRQNRSRTLDAPSWLWRAVVELVASHEAAYLDHCRRHVTPEAA